MKYLGLVAVAGTACGPSIDHTAVTIPPQNPTPQQRMWFWDNYKPVAKGEETISYCRGVSCDTTHYPLVRIADGRVIRDPDDVAALVAPDSQTMREAHHADRIHARLKWWGLGTVAGVVGGFYLAMHGNETDDTTMRNVGLGIAVGSILVGVIGGYIEKDNVRAARARAWRWYAHDLAEQMHVCANGITVVPCETITPGAPPPPAQLERDPNLDQLRQR